MILDEVYNRVRQTVERHGLLQGGECVLVALSGGPDSMVLLRVLKELAVEYQLTLAALHVDHRLRSGSAAEAQQVRAWCADLDIPCNIRQIDVQARRQN